MGKKYKSLQIIGYLEALSYLALLLIAMPLKYFWDFPDAVKYVGWAHGLLFMLYIFFLLVNSYLHHWKFKYLFFGFLASILPFGPFIFDRKILKELN